MRTLWGSATDQGLVRSINEDSLLAYPPVFLVADGMGGHDAGNVASRVVVDEFTSLIGRDHATTEEVHDAIIRAASRMREALGDRTGGTTVAGAALTVIDDGEYWLVFNVGDSRVYRLGEAGLEQISVDFVFGTAGTNVQGKVRTVLRAIEDNLKGETMTTAHALVSSEFFDKLISHPKTEDAYKFFSATGGQPLREDMRRAFPFAGILFEEYNGSVTLSNGTSERLIPTGEGIAFPMGTFDTFTTYGGPANLLETANTIGLPLYARQMMDAKGRWIDLMTEASILPVNKRPRLAIRLHSGN